MSASSVLKSWPLVFTVTGALHVAFFSLPVVVRDDRRELESVPFELTEAPAEPPRDAEPAPPPAPSSAPPPPSNRAPAPDLEPGAPPPPLVTGVPLEASQLAPSGVGLAVRVGNTDVSGHDADVDPAEIRGFASPAPGPPPAPPARMEKPSLLRAFEPPYPQAALEARAAGTVALEVTVGPNGRAW